MQMFHTPVTYAMQGDRVGICVTQFDPKLLERGLICTPESLHTIHAAIISLKKIQYFRGALQTKAKFHITVGHETVMGRVMFFSPAPADFNAEIQEDIFDLEKDYLYQEEYLSKDSSSSEENKENDQAGGVQLPRQQWALLEFEKPVTCPKLCLVIGSKLDTDIHANTCRLAFHGVLLQGMEDKNYTETFLPKLKVYKLKHKEGQVERVSRLLNALCGKGKYLFCVSTRIDGLRSFHCYVPDSLCTFNVCVPSVLPLVCLQTVKLLLVTSLLSSVECWVIWCWFFTEPFDV